jgi:hypothetical protein
VTRLNAETLADITFRASDSNPTRLQKLEFLRRWIIEQIEAILGDGTDDSTPPPAANEYERVRAWWKDAPASDQTLIIWPFETKVTIPSSFDGSVGFLGGALVSDAVIEVYRDPTFTGDEITGGELIGTVTIDHTDNSYTFATVDNLAYVFDINQTLAAKWQTAVEPAADAGAFVLQALFGEVTTFRLLLAGDQQSGEDVLLLFGDQQSDGNDALLVGGSS